MFNKLASDSDIMINIQQQKCRISAFGSSYHDNENSHENSNEVSEKVQSMLHIVQITEVSSLNYFLGIDHHVAHKHQKSKVQLQILSRAKSKMLLAKNKQQQFIQ